MIQDGENTSYVYLFVQDGNLPQSPFSYVEYKYSLNSGSYLQTFNTGKRRNGENTFINTLKYKYHFSAEWIADQLVLNGVDLLDRHKNFFADGDCLRSEDTFSDGNNAFATNKAGAVRVIRSYLGANSGDFTQRTNIFYESRMDITTDLRVHPIDAIVDAYDYAPAVNGYKYYNNMNTAGVIINGSQDNVKKGPLQWELVSGAAGSIIHLHTHFTDILPGEAVDTSYYDDNKSRPAANCTGDRQAWGTSGVAQKFLTKVCTDPLKCDPGVPRRYLKQQRVIYIEATNATISTAQDLNSKYRNPLIVTVN